MVHHIYPPASSPDSISYGAVNSSQWNDNWWSNIILSFGFGLLVIAATLSSTSARSGFNDEFTNFGPFPPFPWRQSIRTQTLLSFLVDGELCDASIVIMLMFPPVADWWIDLLNCCNEPCGRLRTKNLGLAVIRALEKASAMWKTKKIMQIMQDRVKMDVACLL